MTLVALLPLDLLQMAELSIRPLSTFVPMTLAMLRYCGDEKANIPSSAFPWEASLLLFKTQMKALWGAFCAIFTVAVAISFWVSNEQTQTSADITGVAITKGIVQSQSKRELEIAIHRAQRAVIQAQEALQEDEWGISERRYVEPTNPPSDDPRPNTEESQRRSNPTIREVHIAKANAAKARLEYLKAQFAKVN